MLLKENIIIEQEILGGILNNNALLEDAKDFITENMFQVKDHQAIYRELKRLIEKGSEVDAVNFIYHLKDKTAKLGGVNYIYEISECNPTDSTFKSKLEILINSHKSNLINKMSNKLITTSNIEDKISLVEDTMKDIYSNSSATEIKPREDWNNYMLTLEKRMKGEVERGISTGLNALDNLIRGLKPGKVITVQARSGVGKTVFGLQIASNVSFQNKNVFYSTGEMDEEEVKDRIVASSCLVDYERVMEGKISDKEAVDIVNTSDILAETNFYVSEETNFKKAVNELKLYIQKFGKVNVWVLDYIDLFIDGVPGENKTQRLGYISKSVKKLARDYKMTVILLAQTKRTVDKENKNSEIYEKVGSADIQGSGEVEQDSDIIMSLYRNLLWDNEMARKHLKIDKSAPISDLNPEVINLTVTKGRACKKGTIALSWEGQFQKIGNFIRG